jgi:hypothetical protein
MMVRKHIWVALTAMVVLLGCGCGHLGIGAASTDAKVITYEVEFADRSPGEADVTYTDSSGKNVTSHVTTPWTSGPINVLSGQSYRLSASAVDKGTNLYCGVHTDTGWNAGNSLRGGRCSYAYPDDVNK